MCHNNINVMQTIRGRKIALILFNTLVLIFSVHNRGSSIKL